MNTLFKILAFTIIVGLTSCTDTDNIIPENERTTLQAIDKADVTAPGSEDDEDEHNNDL